MISALMIGVAGVLAFLGLRADRAPAVNTSRVDRPRPQAPGGTTESTTVNEPSSVRARPLTWAGASSLPLGHPERELDRLARTVWGEARGETTLGKAGVAHAILKRVRSNRYGWPDTVEGVVMQRNQFEPWGNPSRAAQMRALEPGDASFEAAWEVARGVMAGEVADPTGGADHFFAPAVLEERGTGAPSWASAALSTARIGGHIFARLT